MNEKMSWLIHRWFLISVLVYKGCQSLFLRHTKSGKCITTGELVYNIHGHVRYHSAVMTDNCLRVKAQFRYYHSELLLHIETGGALSFKWNRMIVFEGLTKSNKISQLSDSNRLKQTAAGSLYFYNNGTCAQPNETSLYVDGKIFCDTPEQKFAFGSVTQYNTKMKDVNCSSLQRMVVKRADYGDFSYDGVFDGDASIDAKCSPLTNCQVKSLCCGNTVCGLTIDDNLLPSHYCPDVSKEIYTEHSCVDTYSSTSITTAPNIKLSESPFKGFIEIKDGSTWRKVNEKNWEKTRQKLLCQHLGFDETDKNVVDRRELASEQEIATGDMICYNTQPSGTSCCVHLQPSRTVSNVDMPYATCKTCGSPLLQNVTTFPDFVFSGNGSSNYKDARFSENGWCATGSGTKYLLLDLQKEYHITRVVAMGNKEQTLWSWDYALKYSHDKTLVDGSSAIKIKGNLNGYQASITIVDIYDVRYLKIESTTKFDFCLRIELCGEVQSPVIMDITVKPSDISANLSWTAAPAGYKTSINITHILIYLNGTLHKKISQQEYLNQFIIRGLKPYTMYTVGIQAQDYYLVKSRIMSKTFQTQEREEDLDNKGDDNEESKKAKQSCDDNLRLDLLIPLIALSVSFLFLLGVFIGCYINQRHLLQNSNHIPKLSKRTDEKENLDSKSMNDVEAAQKKSYVNDETIYEVPDDVLEYNEQNDLESARSEISTEQEPPYVISIKGKDQPDETIRYEIPNDLESPRPEISTELEPPYVISIKGNDQPDETIRYENLTSV